MYKKIIDVDRSIIHIWSVRVHFFRGESQHPTTWLKGKALLSTCLTSSRVQSYSIFFELSRGFCWGVYLQELRPNNCWTLFGRLTKRIIQPMQSTRRVKISNLWSLSHCMWWGSHGEKTTTGDCEHPSNLGPRYKRKSFQMQLWLSNMVFWNQPGWPLLYQIEFETQFLFDPFSTVCFSEQEVQEAAEPSSWNAGCHRARPCSCVQGWSFIGRCWIQVCCFGHAGWHGIPLQDWCAYEILSQHWTQKYDQGLPRMSRRWSAISFWRFYHWSTLENIYVCWCSMGCTPSFSSYFVWW